mgnify:CR=1 FL=1
MLISFNLSGNLIPCVRRSVSLSLGNLTVSLCNKCPCIRHLRGLRLRLWATITSEVWPCRSRRIIHNRKWGKWPLSIGWRRLSSLELHLNSRTSHTSLLTMLPWVLSRASGMPQETLSYVRLRWVEAWGQLAAKMASSQFMMRGQGKTWLSWEVTRPVYVNWLWWVTMAKSTWPQVATMVAAPSSSGTFQLGT